MREPAGHHSRGPYSARVGIPFGGGKSGSLTEARETHEVVGSRTDKAFDAMCARMDQCRVTPRTACQIVAVEEMVRTMHDRVWI